MNHREEVLVKVTVKLIFWLICFVGIVYQVATVSKIYFAYKINTVVTMNYPQFVIRPSMTICFNTVEIFDWTKLSKTKMRRILNESESELASVLGLQNILNADEPNLNSNRSFIKAIRDITTRQKIIATGILNRGLNAKQIIDRTVKHLNFISQCFDVDIFNYTYGRVNCSEKYTLDIYTRGMVTCMRLDSTDKEQKYSYVKLNQMITKGLLFQFDLRAFKLRERTSNIMLSFAKQKEYLRFGFINNVIPNVFSEMTVLTIRIYQSQLLKSPYETDCLDYNRLKLFQDSPFSPINNRGDCIEACLLQESTSSNFMAPIYPELSVTKEITNKIIPLSSLYRKSKLYQRYFQDKKDCTHICRKPECDIILFSPQIVSPREFGILPSMHHSIKIYTTDLPITSTKSVAKLDFVEYWSYISGIIGFWIGFSVFHVIDALPFIREWKSKTNVHQFKQGEQRNPKFQLHRIRLSQIAAFKTEHCPKVLRSMLFGEKKVTLDQFRRKVGQGN